MVIGNLASIVKDQIGLPALTAIAVSALAIGNGGGRVLYGMLSDRKMEEMGTHAENVLSLFSRRRRRMTTSLTKRRLTQQAKADVEESIDAIDDLERQIRDLETEFKEKLDEIGER